MEPPALQLGFSSAPAGLGSGVYGGTDEIGTIWQLDRAFEPRMSRDEAGARLAAWDHAVRQVLAV